MDLVQAMTQTLLGSDLPQIGEKLALAQAPYRQADVYLFEVMQRQGGMPDIITYNASNHRLREGQSYPDGAPGSSRPCSGKVRCLIGSPIAP